MEAQIDIVIPCYNPPIGWAENLIQTHKQLSVLLEKTINLILVNDGSTADLTKDLNHVKSQIPTAHIIKYSKNMGKGYALRKGVEVANSTSILFTDVDFPYTSKSIENVVAELDKGEDVVLGTRSKIYYANLPRMRKLISTLLRFVLKNILRLAVTDSQCGLKGFNQYGKALFLNTTVNRFLFDLEFVYIISREKKIKIKLVEAVLRPNIIFSKVGWKVLIIESINFLKIVIRQFFSRN